jgi:hypothetical protein
VVANRADIFSQRYGRDPDFELVASSNSVPLLQKYTDWSTGNMVLSNSGDEVLVLDEFDQVVDALSYGDSLWAFAPPIARVSEGYSLERYPANQDTDHARDWRAQPMPNPYNIDLRPPTATPSRTPTRTATPTHGDAHTNHHPYPHADPDARPDRHTSPGWLRFDQRGRLRPAALRARL